MWAANSRSNEGGTIRRSPWGLKQHWLFCISFLTVLWANPTNKTKTASLSSSSENGLSKKICQPECHDSIRSYPSPPAKQKKRNGGNHTRRGLCGRRFFLGNTCASQPLTISYTRRWQSNWPSRKSCNRHTHFKNWCVRHACQYRYHSRGRVKCATDPVNGRTTKKCACESIGPRKIRRTVSTKRNCWHSGLTDSSCRSIDFPHSVPMMISFLSRCGHFWNEAIFAVVTQKELS